MNNQQGREMKRIAILLTTCLVYCISGYMSEVQAQKYTFYVAAESDDKVYRVSFDAESGQSEIENSITVGEYPTENEGPHGIGVDPGGEYWYVSLGHGMPFGHLYKYELGTDKVVSRTELGMFPATLDISAETGWVYVVNFNLHGPHEPSSLSIVDGKTMEEIERVETGVMPHGSRLNSDGTLQYHVSMMTDELYEIDAITMEVSRVLSLGESGDNEHHSGHSNMSHESEPLVKPTWASPHPDKAEIYVAGNGNDHIYIIDSENWEIKEKWETPGIGPYNLEPTHSGDKLVVSYKGEGATGVWDLKTGEQLAKIENSRKVTHGMVITPDDRFAFVTAEGVGAESGVVDIIDLKTLKIVDTVEVGKQAAGIAFWKMEQSSAREGASR